MISEFLKYAIPSAFAMLVSALYTIIDGIFVGQGVGDNALAAVNIVLPFTVMLVGIANMMAVGGGALISKNIGAKNIEKAVNIFRQVCKFLLIVTVFISLVCVIFAKPIVKMLGATEALETLAVDYLKYYAIFCIPNLVGLALNSFVRNDGKPKLAMYSIIAGAITNIILDYVFIFPFGLGIKGAAIATGLGQIVTVAIMLPHFIQKKGCLTFGKVKIEKEVISDLLKIGFPSFLSQISFSFIVLVHNLTLVNVMGEIGVSAYSILNYIGTNIYMVLFGLTLGAQPLISYNFGRKDKDKVLKYYKINSMASIVTTAVFVVICYVFGKQIIGIFTNDKQILEIAYFAVKLGTLSYFMVGLNIGTIVFYQAIEMPKLSTLICLFRSVIFLPISLFVLSKVFGADGIWAGTLVSESLTFIAINLIANIKTSTTKSINKLVETAQ
ncbi:MULTISPECIES: MATE family efflux transporter [Romboutsia]|uniref:Multidrug export protein MepA n=1 Tax=Romboutsia hominis TaxID=1507512 RepID=A0A2P2BRB3_9FIRM|nr:MULTISPECIES: MATE family efflux transporter [Romboutsia]MCH1960230.1 MATE family efflux transporter [Romboutsia hominis]MCH1969335.1 MATE family efflux transporter [Romboutsia hominis]MDB8791252.1 MATE family efflux transporter [Romboutsia sp. 1001216sp1]MDB8794078.1 MATE family efflux transporter [Romboutsia sp. 1001216sp1]MDB8796376.1 MATE family efflux transporter [Romboutsia sp. 1001216sp1]